MSMHCCQGEGDGWGRRSADIPQQIQGLPAILSGSLALHRVAQHQLTLRRLCALSTPGAVRAECGAYVPHGVQRLLAVLDGGLALLSLTQHEQVARNVHAQKEQRLLAALQLGLRQVFDHALQEGDCTGRAVQ